MVYGRGSYHRGGSEESTERPSLRSCDDDEERAKRLLLNVSCALDPLSQSVMVSVGISKLGCTDLVFVDQGIKINGAYLLPRRAPVTAAATRDARGVRGILRLSTVQRPCTPGTRHCATSRAGNTSVHSTGSLASEQPRPCLLYTSPSPRD